MYATDIPCMHIPLANCVANFMDVEFDAWMRSKTGGDNNMHLTLFRFMDRASLHLAKWAMSFNNHNIIELGRPVTELGLTHLKKAELITKNIEYLFQLITCSGVPRLLLQETGVHTPTPGECAMQNTLSKRWLLTSMPLEPLVITF